ncbi:hypothetical protein PATY110618_23550 [Paenibacillus typhae]|uniref:Uncharacterized protein n=1 Tax=Paenibacillus typhae TaxID=1174501 RepID=A0A1G9DD11_9BACL|nr:hypothetical protein SAMN05216192_14738 [Paenibacillus typhae]
MCFREPVGGANRQQAPLNYSLKLSGGTQVHRVLPVVRNRGIPVMIMK